MEKILLTVAEAAPQVGSRTVLYELIGAGRISARKLGSRTMIEAQSLRDFIASLPPAAIKASPRRRAA